ncbi:MAG: VWA domain-containing protein [Bacteroidales bacterium]
MNRRHWVFAASAVLGLAIAASSILGGARLLASSTAVAGRQQQQPQNPPQQQQPPQQPQQQQPTFRTGVNVVRVDVIATDKRGAHVTDLKASDFSVWEDGRPQRIDTFRLVTLESEPLPLEPDKEIRSMEDEETELAREGNRIIVMLLDDYHVRIDSGMRMKPALKRFVQTQLGPRDLVAIMYPMTPVSALRFTRDRYELASEIERFEGRLGNYGVRNAAEGRYAGAPPETVEYIRTQVSLSALESLVTHLGSVREGRKSVVLVSEGFWLPFEEQREFEHVYSAANRSNTAIYTLDPGGLSMNGNTSAKDSLRILADNTDGRAVVNRNDLEGGLSAVLRDSESYYLLGYNSDLNAPDGKFHEIKVRVKRPDVEVRARKGYWAPTAEEAAKATAPSKPEAPAAVTKALGEIATPVGGRLIRSWVGTSRGEAGKTRITFAWKPAPSPPDTPSAERPAKLSVTASGPGGVTYFNGISEATTVGGASAAAPVPRGSGVAVSVPSRVQFDAVPGKMQVKWSLQSATGETLEGDTREVVVPDLTSPKVALSTPAVFVARPPREYRDLLADETDSVPTPERQFGRADRVVMKGEAYGPGGSPPTVTVRLLNRNGQEMTTLTARPGASNASRYLVELPLVGVAAGEYLIEITAKGESGEATEMVAIKVAG